jgi:hypothetical protein
MQKGLATACKIEKNSTKIKEYCLWLSNTFLQPAKGLHIALGTIAKGYQIPFRANCMRNPRIACNIDLVGNIPLGKLNLKFKNNGEF